MAERLTLPEVWPQALAYLQKHEVGAGSLHIVLDDCNVSDDDVRHCVEWAESEGDAEGAELARSLLRLTKTQRLKMADEWRRKLRDHGEGVE